MAGQSPMGPPVRARSPQSEWEVSKESESRRSTWHLPGGEAGKGWSGGNPQLDSTQEGRGDRCTGEQG